MAITQIGQQAIKPTRLGEVTRGLQGFRAGQQGIQNRELQQLLQKLQLQNLVSQIGTRDVTKKKTAAQTKQIETISKLLSGTSFGDFEPTFGPAGVTLRPRTKPSAAERKEIAGTETSIDSLNNLKTLFEDKETETGPIVGRISPTAGLFGKTTQAQEDLMAATAAFKNRIIKEITGAQMSEPEAKRIMKQVPDITDPPARWLAKWNQTVKNLDSIRKRREEVLEASGVRVPKVKRGIPVKQKEDVFTVGETRTNSRGQKAKYLGDGQWRLIQ